ncbi:MAG: hypothetical protein ACK47B_22795 [Armatimonadota bacterium]
MSSPAPPSAGAAWLRRSVLLFGILAALPAIPSDAATPRRYELEQRKISDAETRLRLYNRRTGRTVWTRTIAQVEQIAWSKDGTALAVVDDRAGVWNRSGYFRLIYWRVGERVQVRDDLRPLERFEGLIDLEWSPDNRRLLLLGGLSMGALMVGTGDLWCFDTRADRSSMLAGDHDIAAAEWLSSTGVRVRTRVLLTNEDAATALKEGTRILDVRYPVKPDPRSNYHDGR